VSQLEELMISCPYCGERISVLIDSEEINEQYTEDCQVCCRPMVFKIRSSDLGALDVSVHCEDDVI